MNPTKEQIVAIIFESIDEVNELMGSNRQVQKSLQTNLLKHGEGLDSLGFINFVSLIEEKYSRLTGRIIVLTQAGVKSSVTNPFETIGTLAEYIEASAKS
jgi:acyl carrier protein